MKRDLVRESQRYTKAPKADPPRDSPSDTRPDNPRSDKQLSDTPETLHFSTAQLKSAPTVGLPHWITHPIIIPDDVSPVSDSVSTATENKLKLLNITSWFPVQHTLLPLLLQTRYSSDNQSPGDLLVNAQTGSGKTLAYVVPLVETLRLRVVIRVRALVVVPTRDLAMQVKLAFDSVNERLKIGLAVGHSSFAHEQSQFVSTDEDDVFTEDGGSSKIDILIATPGRLVDHLEKTKGFTLKHLRFLVIDEADRLLAQSFHNWLDKIFISLEQDVEKTNISLQKPQRYASQKCQKLLFSATQTSNPAKLALLRLHNPRSLSLTTPLPSMPASLTESFTVTTSKPLTLIAVLKPSTLIFTNTLDSASRLSQLLSIACPALKISTLTSATLPTTRRQIIRDFIHNSILICTDMSARGLDLDVSTVIHYDLPSNLRTYIHRTGRTARANRAGSALSLLESSQVKWFKSNISKTKHVVRTSKIKMIEVNVEEVRGGYEKALALLKDMYGRKDQKKDNQVRTKSDISSSNPSSSSSDSSSSSSSSSSDSNSSSSDSSSDDSSDSDVEMEDTTKEAVPMDVDIVADGVPAMYCDLSEWK